MTGAALLALDGSVVDVVVVVDDDVVVVDDVVVDEVVDADVVVGAVVVVVDAVVVVASLVDVEAGWTTIVPRIDECTLQWYVNVAGPPVSSLNVSPGFMQLSVCAASQFGLESNVAPLSSDVTE